MYRRCDAGGNGSSTFGVRRVAIVAVNHCARARSWRQSVPFAPPAVQAAIAFRHHRATSGAVSRWNYCLSQWAKTVRSDSKSGVPARVSGVRIPRSPPIMPGICPVGSKILPSGHGSARQALRNSSPRRSPGRRDHRTLDRGPDRVLGPDRSRDRARAPDGRGPPAQAARRGASALAVPGVGRHRRRPPAPGRAPGVALVSAFRAGSRPPRVPRQGRRRRDPLRGAFPEPQIQARQAEVTSPFDARPIVVALAGPNGAGKSTFHAAFVAPAALRFVNADDLGRELSVDAQEAVRLANELRRTLVDQRESFVFETVLSDPVGDKVEFLRKAAAEKGYTVVLCYIGIDSAEVSQERVAMRVLQGGHDVLDDNGDLSSPFRQVAEFRDGQPAGLRSPLPAWLGWKK